MSRLVGMGLEEIIDAVEAAAAPEDRHILAAIGEQTEDYHATLPDLTSQEGRLHGFMVWVGELHRGQAALPERLPRIVLETWRDFYRPSGGPPGQPSPWCPWPMWRCEDCLMVLPSCDGEWPACPVCASKNILRADLSRGLGYRWIGEGGVYSERAV